MPNAQKVEALTKMLIPKDLKQLRSLWGGLFYYRKFLRYMVERIWPITPALTSGTSVKIIFGGSGKFPRTPELLDNTWFDSWTTPDRSSSRYLLLGITVCYG